MSKKNQPIVDEGENNCIPLEHVQIVEDISAKQIKGKTKEVEDKVEPLMTDIGWSEFVLSQFDEKELDPNGNPKVDGLRRIGKLLLGPILYSGAEPFQAPSFAGGNLATMMQPAVVTYTLKILMSRLEQGMEMAYEMTFKAVADCYIENTDPEYARFASATAATRAEAICWRKALLLKNVSSEELTSVPIDLGVQTGKINVTQVNFIKVLCKRNNINVMKFVNMGKRQYDNILDVDYGVAASMVEYLSGLQNSGKIDEKIKGYDEDWQKQ